MVFYVLNNNPLVASMNFKAFLYTVTLFGLGAILTGAVFAETNLQQVQNDLKVLDDSLMRPVQVHHIENQAKQPSEETVIPLSAIKNDVKARDVYRQYLAKASHISAELLNLRDQLDKSSLKINNEFTLQRLAALSQQISLDHQAFQSGFEHCEDSFYSYRLIDKAVKNLADAVRYWRLSQRYQTMYRGSANEQASDDEVLILKLTAARQAIDELKTVMDVRQALDADLKEE
jgi:hypothetical protein